MATKKKARGKRGGDVVRIKRMYRGHPQPWVWERYASNNEYIAGSWPETFARKAACRKSAERAMTKCPIVEEK